MKRFFEGVEYECPEWVNAIVKMKTGEIFGHELKYLGRGEKGEPTYDVLRKVQLGVTGSLKSIN